jgi:elongation factor Tu
MVANIAWNDSADGPGYCPGHAAHVKNMITGASPTYVSVLLLSAAGGPMPQTREYVRIARQVGVRSLVVRLNKVEVVADLNLLGLVDLINLEARDLTTRHRFDNEAVSLALGGDCTALDWPSSPKSRPEPSPG